MRPLEPQCVAAFDVDGTLTRRDTLLPFLARVRGRTRTAAVLARHGGPLALAVARHGERDVVKQAVLTRLVGGRPYREVTAQAEQFAAEVYASGLRSDTLARWEWHRGQGHRVVMVSASLAEYLEPLGRLLGASAVLCSRLEVDTDGRMTGRLDGGNCRGPEKVARLQAWLGAPPSRLWAYGDSRGDRELLASADVAHLLRRRQLLPAVPPDPAAPLPATVGGQTA